MSDDGLRGLIGPGIVESGTGLGFGVEHCLDHRLDWTLTAEDVACLFPPGRALPRQCSRLVLGVPCLQRRLLGQRDRLHRGGWPSVAALELGGQVTAAGLDAVPPGRPRIVEGGVDADEFADRTLPRITTRTGGEPDAERLGQVTLQRGVVGL